MHFYLSTSNDPYYNLALEEYLLKHLHEDILLCYVNVPSIVVGRFQVPYREVSAPFVYDKDIKMARRLSGGGTVYHDLGNLNYSFITNCADQATDYYDLFNQKTLDVLTSLGLGNLSFQRNNIFCQEKKISGVAQYKRGKRMVHHGTLLVDADLQQLRTVFTPKDYYQTKGVASVSSSVANVNSFVHLTMADVIKAFEASCDEVLQALSTDEGVVEMADYYSTKEWIFGKSPKYTLEKADTTLLVEQGRVVSVSDPRHSTLVGLYHSFEDVLSSEIENAALFF